MGIVAGRRPLDIVNSFTTGFGADRGSVGLLIALGAMVGKLLADSGAATRLWRRSSAASAPAGCRGRWP